MEAFHQSPLAKSGVHCIGPRHLVGTGLQGSRGVWGWGASPSEMVLRGACWRLFTIIILVHKIIHD